MITITIQDPTANEATALRAYLTALHGGTAAAPSERIVVQHTERAGVVEVRQTIYETDEPPAPALEDTVGRTREAMAELSESQAVTAEDAGAPDFDSAGMPWDERIHASSRATVADGTWRKKRGVSDELVAEVEAEYEKAKDLGNHLNELLTPQVPDAPSPKFTPEEEIPQADQDAKVLTVDAPPPPPAPTANPFLAVMSRIGKSKLDKAKKDELLTAAGALDEKRVPSILVLNKRPELIDGFIALLDSEGV